METCIKLGDVETFTNTLISLVGVGPSRELLLKSLALLDIKDQKVERTAHNNDASEELNAEREVKKNRREIALSGDIKFEVLERIFGYLDYPTLCKASQVSRAWHEFALDPNLWGTSASLVCPHITQPSLSGDGKLDLRKILRLPRFAQLHSLDLSAWKEGVDDEWLVANLGHLQSLRVLSLNDCSKVAFEHPGLANCLPSLTSLNLGTLAFGQLVSNNSLSVIQQLSNLRKIDLHYCDKINDYGLHHLTVLPKLQYLDLGDCYRITSSGISTLLPLSSSLTWLSFKSPRRSNTFIKDNGLQRLVSFSRLTHLDIGWCKRITDEGMEHVGKLMNLTHLGLASTPITDSGLHSLRHLSNITVLDTTFCYSMTTEAAVMVTNNYPHLKQILFRGVPLGKYNPLNLLRLGECRCLEEIDFTNTYIDDDILAAQYCKQGVYVTKMNVSYCSQISDLAVFNMCCYTPRLTHLNLSHCSKLTDKSLQYLQEAKNLKQVEITGIYSFSKDALARLASARPKLKIINDNK